MKWRPTRAAIAAAAALLVLSATGPAWGENATACQPTPPQTEGPFYPVHQQDDKDNDLTLVKGHAKPATGQVIYIVGEVRGPQCRPIAGVLVEIWQAAASGRYRHPDDRNMSASHDPDFQHWGVTVTDQEGRYQFKTVKPSPYPASFFWTRPSHIHFKVYRKGFPTLTTQMYFAGDPYLEKDLIFRRIPEPARPQVVVQLKPPARDMEPDAKVCRFDITF
ncbi:MAG: hypothetical protein HY581_07295 [Nitrospirae bacterium]|nr:hypothetical protein [Nitrospirota bacterium]